MVCWDVEKMFDRMPREFIWESMRKVGVDEGIIAAAQSTLLDTNCVLHVEGLQRKVNVAPGSAQGTSLGPVPCLFFFLPILDLWAKRMETRSITTVVENENGDREELSAGLNNFADDAMLVLSSEEETATVVAEFICRARRNIPNHGPQSKLGRPAGQVEVGHRARASQT